jgi:NADH:quinone reductase (non-electrogenic)
VAIPSSIIQYVSVVPHVVILGGGFGGLYAARAFKGAPVQVTLVDRHNYHLFQPMLYQVATAALSPGDIASPTRWVLREQKNVRVLLAEVDRIDPNAQLVMLNEGDPGQPHEQTLKYDYLILATGSTHAYFGHPEWSTRALGLKTLDDALEIRRQVLLSFEAAEREQNEAAQRRLLTFVIVGAGPTGVELAGALAEIARQALRQDFRNIRPESARILLLEGGPTILSTFPEILREKAGQSLQRLGIEVRTNSVVTMVDPEGVMVGGERIPAQTVLWAAGVAASPLARSLGAPLDRAGRVLVEPTLAVPGHPQIFVIGDLASLQQDGRPLPGVAQVAIQGGKHAAKNILRAICGEPLLPFRYRDYGNVAVIGRGSAVVDVGGAKASGFFAWVFWLFLHIFWLIGFRNRVTVLIEWAWSYITMQRGVRLITGERLAPRS